MFKSVHIEGVFWSLLVYICKHVPENVQLAYDD